MISLTSQVCSFKLHAYGKIYYRTCRAKLFLLTHGMNKSTGFYYGLVRCVVSSFMPMVKYIIEHVVQNYLY